MRSVIYIFLFIGLSIQLFGQNILFQKTQQALSGVNTLDEYILVDKQDKSTDLQYLDNYLDAYEVYQIDLKQIDNLLRNDEIVISFPIYINGKLKNLLLYQDYDIAQYSLSTSDGQRFSNLSFNQAFYKGVIENDENSLVAVSVFQNDLRILVSNDDGNYTLSQLDNREEYIFYNDKDLKVTNPFDCKNGDIHHSFIEKSGDINSSRMTGECVPIYVECDFNLYGDQGNNIGNVNNFVTALFNEISTIFTNESLSIAISDVFIHTSNDPYVGINDIEDVLYAFGDETQNSFDGVLAHLLSGRSLGGGIAWVDVICANYNAGNSYGPYGVTAGLSSSVTPFPNYSWNVGATSHELGHNFGSPHTHACAWGTLNNQALDDCAATEGSCAAGPSPTNGGTIMSYCHITSDGINFNNGFGQEPGDLIREEVANASCNLICGSGLNDDASVVSISDAHSCGDSISIISSIGNNGNNTISSATIELYLDGNLVNSKNWTGSLGTGQTTNVQIGTNGLSASTFNTCVKLANPNNNADPDQSNNEQCSMILVEASCPYCTSQGSNSSEEWIANVEIGAFSHSSGSNNGYADNTNLTINLCKTVDYDITLTPDFNGGPFDELWRIWIDYNNDGDFEDANELAYDAPSATNSAVNGIINVPNTAVEGNTLMRVSMKYNNNTGDVEPCETFQWGEVEDFTASITTCACPDGDLDGVCDADDLCPGFNDADDMDHDLTPDGCDECPNDPLKTVAGFCGCGETELDSDLDGTPDCVDLCPGFDDEIDEDMNGTPDGCDEGCPDADDDGVCDSNDQCPGFDDSTDLDEDSVPDGCDLCFGDNSFGDSDGDGICNDPNISCINYEAVVGFIQSGVYQGRIKLKSTGTIQEDTIAFFRSPIIDLLSGFEVEQGAIFETVSDGCN